jgi:beta-1,4-mannosyltransferase
VNDRSVQPSGEREPEVALRLARFQLARAEQRVAELERELKEVRDSRTYRVGRLVARPLLAVRAARRWLQRRRQPALGLRQRLVAVRRGRGARRRAPRGPVAALPAAVDTELLGRLEAALAPHRDPGGELVIAFAVSSTDPTTGRGDVHAAFGLGEALRDRGFGVAYLGPDDWYRPPRGTRVLVSMLAEGGASLEPRMVPEDVRLVAWIRNATERWLTSPWLELHDEFWCSSLRAVDALRRRTERPVTLVPLAVDASFVRAGRDEPRTAVVSTVQPWGSRGALEDLAASGIEAPLALFGAGGHLPAALRRFAQGPIPFAALPDVYGGAAVVLDDVQGPNRVHGHVNARVLDALAAGALPVTNSARGLEDLGLRGVPVAGDRTALATIIRRASEDPSWREATLAPLRAQVVEQHTWDVRASTLEGMLRSTEVRPSRRTVAFAPDYRADNPYQRLLYTQLATRAIGQVPVTGPADLLGSVRPDAADLVYHQHWTATILGPGRDREERLELLRTYLDQLDQLLAAGASLVWTVHNVLPHECADPALEGTLRREIGDRSAAVHVMCAATVTEVEPHYPLPADRTVVIPHGSYVGVYPGVASVVSSRQRLGLAEGELVFGFVGQIRPYKGLDELLDAYTTVRPELPPSRLVVAGAPGKTAGMATLLRRCRDTPGVVLLDGVVDDDALQDVFAAIDVIVLPYRTGLNSGLLHLAQTFGRPVVCRAVGCLPQHLADGAGVPIGDSPEALADGLREASRLDRVRAGAAAREHAARFTSVDMATAYADLVERVLGSKDAS